jgi:hypothetical protein
MSALTKQSAGEASSAGASRGHDGGGSGTDVRGDCAIRIGNMAGAVLASFGGKCEADEGDRKGEGEGACLMLQAGQGIRRM